MEDSRDSRMGTFSLLLSANYEIIILIEHTKFAFELFDSQKGNISTQVLPHNALKGWLEKNLAKVSKTRSL